MTAPLQEIGEQIWSIDSGREGAAVCLSFGVHGNERAPIDAGLRLAELLRSGELELAGGRLLLIHANPRASVADRRWTDGGVDLNRCFHRSVLAREPALHEERRARDIVGALEAFAEKVLVDFHCTVERGKRFLMQHPPIADPAHRAVTRLLRAGVLLADPELNFGSVSLDEWMSTRDRVGICYETGWIGDPENSPEVVLEEMRNVLAGNGLVAERAAHHDSKRLLELDAALVCEAPGFRWREGVGLNLQALPAGTVLGAYDDGREVVLESDATLIFPKKRPELLAPGKPLVYLASDRGAAS